MPTLNVWLSKNCQKVFLSENIGPKMQNLCLKTSILEKFKSKVKNSNVRNVFC